MICYKYRSYCSSATCTNLDCSRNINLAYTELEALPETQRLPICASTLRDTSYCPGYLPTLTDLFRTDDNLVGVASMDYATLEHRLLGYDNDIFHTYDTTRDITRYSHSHF
jgi:hypothetical protein